MCENSASFWKGSNTSKVAFVFECPGQEEENQSKPVAGQTGENLNIVLDFLVNYCSKKSLFHSIDRYDYRILNLSEKVYYKAKNGRTIPLIRDIRPDKNINRIIEQIGECDTVIFFNKSKKYDKVMNKIQNKLNNKKIIRVRHLGFQSINSGIKEDKDGKLLVKGQPGNTEKRLEIIACQIVKLIKKKCSKSNSDS
ncbi:hypothetical protein G8B50_02495 [Enterococcus durans]|uniref:hypothetical protein n=1 Tax=Enterococcus durans TaxID=53345 RepID=UPI0018842190|nr:hypothetical protein [Enterococcus durans]MBE9886576.1 hypothetical protein [Enterococcus durans]